MKKLTDKELMSVLDLLVRGRLYNPVFIISGDEDFKRIPSLIRTKLSVFDLRR